MANPQPATETETASTKSFAEIERLVEDNVNLAHYFAHKYRGPYLEEDELYSAALIGLWRAAEDFDPSRGIPFGSYASLRVKWLALEALNNRRRKSVRRGTEVKFVPLDACQINGRHLAEVIADENGVNGAELAGRTDDEPVLVHALSALSRRDKEVIERRYGIGRDKETLEEVGASLGVTRERIRQIEMNVLASLQSLIRHRHHDRLFSKRQSHHAVRRVNSLKRLGRRL